MQRLEALRESAEEAVKAFAARRVLDKAKGSNLLTSDGRKPLNERTEPDAHGTASLAPRFCARRRTRSRMTPITPSWASSKRMAI
jgi:hypothetical protein